MIEERYSLSDVRKSYIIFICILLALECGLRHLSIGPDTYTYFKKFQRIGIEEWDITGRFIKGQETDLIWKGSANQKMHILTKNTELKKKYNEYKKLKTSKRSWTDFLPMPIQWVFFPL